MANPLLSILNELHGNIFRLSDHESQLHERIRELEKTKSDLEAELEDARSQLAAALSAVVFLKVSHRLADSPDTLADTRRHIARLIRNLDLCINMLKEG